MLKLQRDDLKTKLDALFVSVDKANEAFIAMDNAMRHNFPRLLDIVLQQRPAISPPPAATSHTTQDNKSPATI